MRLILCLVLLLAPVCWEPCERIEIDGKIVYNCPAGYDPGDCSSGCEVYRGEAGKRTYVCPE